MRILISGAGIGGLTLAYWLHKTGHTPVVIERANSIRTEGYMIDFVGSSWDVSNRMGLIPQLQAHAYTIEEMDFIDAKGQISARLPVRKVYRALGITDRSLTLDRRDVVETLYQAVQSDVEIHFGTSLTEICQSTHGVEANTTGERLDGTFDLLVGADGIHSNVRQLAFGNEKQYADYLGYYVAAFYVPAVTDKFKNVCAIHVEPNVQFGIYPLSVDRWLVIPIYKSADEGHIPPDQRLAVIRSHLRDVGWIVQNVLDQLAPDAPVFLDTATQIKMPKWSSNRVVLIGDAASCPTLISGQGAALAMAGSYVLTEELNRKDDIQDVLVRYERRLRPHVNRIQTKAQKFAPNFVPDSKLQIAIMNWTLRLIDLPPVTRLFGKQFSLTSIIDAA
jgi:2-polyprenyl-6-methoxyphenol hydroxylase-like FAD-dependent oxidoreductase